MSKNKPSLLWIDLEMTGLEPGQDKILEVAAIVTDWEFQELAIYEGVVHVDEKIIEVRMQKGPAAAFWEANPNARDGLIAQNEHGSSTATIEKALLGFIDEHFEKDDPVILAGNSIHQDRRFIRAEWPLVDSRLHYRMLDVSAWKVVMEGKYKRKFTKPENHRALDDIRGSIEELRYYLKKARF